MNIVGQHPKALKASTFRCWCWWCPCLPSSPALVLLRGPTFLRVGWLLGHTARLDGLGWQLDGRDTLVLKHKAQAGAGDVQAAGERYLGWRGR